MEKHSNLSIVVTGGASGIGAAVCKSLYEQGAVIGIIDVDVNAGESLCRALGDRAFFFCWRCWLRKFDASSLL